VSPSDRKILRCVSCGGFGWFEVDFSGGTEDCDWCAGAGYVYRDEAGRDLPIPQADYAAVAEELEQLELERLREMGYQGGARKPWQQSIRKDTHLGRNPYDDDDNA
jgi:hypothetical protein